MKKEESYYIDAHCHIDGYGDEKIEEIVKDAEEKGVKVIINNGVNKEVNRKVLELSEKYDVIKAALGIYPMEALSMKDSEIDAEINFIRKNKNKIICVGEVGMDFKEDIEIAGKEKKDIKGIRERQKKTFEKFIKLSIELDKPIQIHSRKAEFECIDVLEKMNAKKVIMHCFNGNFNLVKRIADNKWYITIPTNVTFSEHFQKIIRETDIDRLLCETDSPFLHPRKEMNNVPGNIIESYKKIAKIKGLELDEVKKKIMQNYANLFGL